MPISHANRVSLEQLKNKMRYLADSSSLPQISFNASNRAFNSSLKVRTEIIMSVVPILYAFLEKSYCYPTILVVMAILIFLATVVFPESGHSLGEIPSCALGAHYVCRLGPCLFYQAEFMDEGSHSSFFSSLWSGLV